MFLRYRRIAWRLDGWDVSVTGSGKAVGQRFATVRPLIVSDAYPEHYVYLRVPRKNCNKVVVLLCLPEKYRICYKSLTNVLFCLNYVILFYGCPFGAFFMSTAKCSVNSFYCPGVLISP